VVKFSSSSSSRHWIRQMHRMLFLKSRHAVNIRRVYANDWNFIAFTGVRRFLRVKKWIEFGWSFFLFNQFQPSLTSGKTGKTHDILLSLITECPGGFFGLNHSDLHQIIHFSTSRTISGIILALLIECFRHKYQQRNQNLLQIHAGEAVHDDIWSKYKLV
jgi:hypothetical protein